MKAKKLLLLAALMLLPTMMMAGGSGSLFVNNSNKIASTLTRSNGYAGYAMTDAKGCYYNELNGVKYLYMVNANIRFIQGTKSMTDLVIVVIGKCSIECGNHSCIGLEKGSLTIKGPGELTIKQTGKYRCIYTSNGSITFDNANVNCHTANSSACISQEGNGVLTALHSNIYFGTNRERRVYAKGGVVTKRCGLSKGEGVYWDSKTGFISKENGKFDMTEIVSADVTLNYWVLNTQLNRNAQKPQVEGMTHGITFGDINSYRTGPENTIGWTLKGKLYECYLLESCKNTEIEGDVYYCPPLRAFVFWRATVNLDKAPITTAGDLTIFVVGYNKITASKINVNGNIEINGVTTQLDPRAEVSIQSYSTSMTFQKTAKFNDLILDGGNINFTAREKAGSEVHFENVKTPRNSLKSAKFDTAKHNTPEGYKHVGSKTPSSGNSSKGSKTVRK